MRKMIIAATALAFLSSTAFAQDKAGSTTAPAAQSGDTMGMSKDKMSKKTSKKSKKTAKKTEDEMKK
jgi:uncharacterized protein YdeI (BOF family)